MLTSQFRWNTTLRWSWKVTPMIDCFVGAIKLCECKIGVLIKIELMSFLKALLYLCKFHIVVHCVVKVAVRIIRIWEKYYKINNIFFYLMSDMFWLRFLKQKKVMLSNFWAFSVGANLKKFTPPPNYFRFKFILTPAGLLGAAINYPF